MNRMNNKFRMISRARGMTLVEALVALVVLSIGLLGIAGMQMTSLRNNLGAHLRSQATALAYDITDRMRANRTVAVDTNAYEMTFAAYANGATLAQIDRFTWKTALTNTLPGGQGSVERVSGNRFRIIIRWTERNTPLQTFITTTEI